MNDGASQVHICTMPSAVPVTSSLLQGNIARSTKADPSRPPDSLTGSKCSANGACSDTAPSRDPAIDSTSLPCCTTATTPCLCPLKVANGCSGAAVLLAALRSQTFNVPSCEPQEIPLPQHTDQRCSGRVAAPTTCGARSSGCQARGWWHWCQCPRPCLEQAFLTTPCVQFHTHTS